MLRKHHCCSVAKSCPTLCNSTDCSTPGLLSLTLSQSLPKFMFIALVMPSSHLVLCRHLLLLPSIFPSIRDFSSESASCIRWPNYWSFSFSISPSNKYSGLISLKIDWFDLLAVQGTLRNLLQHHSSSVLHLLCHLSVMSPPFPTCPLRQCVPTPLGSLRLHVYDHVFLSLSLSPCVALTV